MEYHGSLVYAAKVIVSLGWSQCHIWQGCVIILYVIGISHYISSVIGISHYIFFVGSCHFFHNEKWYCLIGYHFGRILMSQWQTFIQIYDHDMSLEWNVLALYLGSCQHHRMGHGQCPYLKMEMAAWQGSRDLTHWGLVMRICVSTNWVIVG